MGRPREHDEHTREALLAAAERIVAEGGPAALSVRAVADAADTTTRAVYSLFGSKDGLLVQALARDAFVFLYDEIDALEVTEDPVSDLLDVGLIAFRRLDPRAPGAVPDRVPAGRPGTRRRPGADRDTSESVGAADREGRARRPRRAPR